MIHVPAERDRHAATWMAWPYRDSEWVDLAAARVEIAALASAIAETERCELCVHASTTAPCIDGVRVHRLAYGDCWTRDTCPIFAHRDGELLALTFRFDGWGGKFVMEGDDDLAARVAGLADIAMLEHDLVVEGGAVEFDGAGSLLSTRQCLEPRNRGIRLDEILRDVFGVRRVLWLDGQLRNDHTDGHIDTLARFVSPNRVVCMSARRGDPNETVLRSIVAQLRSHGLDVELLPSPGAVERRPAGSESRGLARCSPDARRCEPSGSPGAAPKLQTPAPTE